MAGNIRQYNLERVTVPACATAHNSGDFGWEGSGTTGVYGVFINSAVAGASADLFVTGTVRLVVPSGMTFGQPVFCPPQPVGPGTPTLQNSNAGGAIQIGIIWVPPDATNTATVALTPQVSMGH